MRPVLWLGLAAVVLLGAVGYPLLPPGQFWPTSDAEAERLRRMEARQQGVLRRIGDKEVAVRALVRGELTLDAAAARFREADAGDPAARAWLRARNPGATDDEMYRRQVIGFLRSGGRPPAAAALADRLEAGLNPRGPVRPGPADATWRPVGKGKDGKKAAPPKKARPKTSPAR